MFRRLQLRLFSGAGFALLDHSTNLGPSIAFWRTPWCSSGAVARRTSVAGEATLFPIAESAARNGGATFWTDLG